MTAAWSEISTVPEKWSDDRQKKVKLAEDVPSELDGLLKIVDSRLIQLSATPSNSNSELNVPAVPIAAAPMTLVERPPGPKPEVPSPHAG